MCYCFHHISWLKSKDNPSFPELSPYADGKLSVGSIHIYLKFSLKDQKVISLPILACITKRQKSDFFLLSTNEILVYKQELYLISINDASKSLLSSSS